MNRSVRRVPKPVLKRKHSHVLRVTDFDYDPPTVEIPHETLAKLMAQPVRS